MPRAKASHDDHSIASSSSIDGASSESLDVGSSSGMSEVTATTNTTVYGVMKHETHTISVMRCMVITTLLTLAAIASNVAFIIALGREESLYKGKLNDYSTKLISKFVARANRKYWVADTLAVEFTSTSDQLNAQWPFVSFRNFQERCTDARFLALASAIWVSPLVHHDKRERWETYALETYDSLQTNFSTTFNPHTFLIPHDARWTDPEPFHEHEQSSVDLPEVLYRDSAWPMKNGIYRISEGKAVANEQEDSYFPIWQTLSSNSSKVKASAMFNQLSDPDRAEALQVMMRTGGSVISRIFSNDTSGSSIQSHYAGPTSAIYFPIFDTLKTRNVIAALTLEIDWESFLQGNLDTIDMPLHVVLENTCGQVHSFEVTGLRVRHLGEGDLHDDSVEAPSHNSSYTSLEFQRAQEDEALSKEDEDFHNDGFFVGYGICQYRIKIYPTQEFKDEYVTLRPTYMQAGIALIFLVVAAIFIVYDCLVERRQNRTMQAAKKSSAIVSAFFPSQFRDRIMDGDSSSSRLNMRGRGLKKKDKADLRSALGTKVPNIFPMETPKLRLKSFMTNAPLHPSHESHAASHDPIADLFPNVSVLFADIAGFTAWSSSREPTQVFMLLETLYGSMDKAARKLGVFKVETIGDCYVAATGLPDPQKDHALIMARFAYTCVHRAMNLTSALESQLGPGTSDLAMRFGIHSGPVTAGVLRGEKSRFQLFGDTMHVAARMENAGVPNKILVSKDTADLILLAGKERWLTQREDLVEVKGMGEIQTYWLEVHNHNNRRSSEKSDPDGRVHHDKGCEHDWGICACAGTDENYDPDSPLRDKQDRLVDWNVDVLTSGLRKIVSRRTALSSLVEIGSELPGDGHYHIPIDEVKEVVQLPTFNAKYTSTEEDSTVLSTEVCNELRDYVSQIAAGYRENPFHNFEHASHVTLSANKLLRRIVVSDDVNYNREGGGDERIEAIARDLHVHTYGISSDPLAQFAVVFSALIHDVGHSGVPNSQLAAERPEIAGKYRQQSIAEQNSIDIAWELLMAPCYSNMRKCIFRNFDEQAHFRQLVVNSILATDIFDKQMNAIRKARWERAFNESTDSADPNVEDLNRRATIVIEHIIQASDVAHTMQHWHVYQKWNERLFHERYTAYLEGRGDTDPSIDWYKGELWFMDNYVIPLAYKLKECGVFGVSGDEYLNYALENRVEWESKGEHILTEWMQYYEDD